jgi:hypothetical protein
MFLIPIPPTYAQLPAETRRSIVKIGDADWYYWNSTTSDTCLLWLGGGITQERDIGYYLYKINPFQYESFGTIKFMQDLAKYYCVIALEKGSSESFSPNLNRTIFQEPYQMDSKIIGEVHDWIRKQGYAHTFLVGYSTGAQVAAMEVSLRAPEEWISPDGLVLITPRLSDFISQKAYRIRASLLVLYGGSVETPAYISTGHQFYDSAPEDGWHNSYYLHKEFRVIEKAGHEVWTIFETGTFDTQAMRILVNFIDNVKSLQFTSYDVEMFAHTTENWPKTSSTDLNLTSVHSLHEISLANIMRVEVTLTYNVQRTSATEIIAFNPQGSKIESAAELILAGSGGRTVNLYLLPPENSSEVSLEIIAFRKTGENLHTAAKPLLTKVKIMDKISVTVVSIVPNMSIVFDGTQFRTAGNGLLRIETKPGTHVVQVESVTYLNSVTRIIFMGWEDGSTQSIRQVTIDNDTSLFSNYRKQYLVNVTSTYGQAEGSGWYDENATAAISVKPMMNAPGVLFARWTGDTSSNEPRNLLTVNSQKTVRATWTPTSSNDSTEADSSLAWLSTSLVLFAVTFAWNIKPFAPAGYEVDSKSLNSIRPIRKRKYLLPQACVV